MDFSTIPTGVDLAPENIDRIDSRVSELTTAFARKVEKYTNNVVEAAERFRTQHQPIADNALPEDRRTIRKHVDRQVERETNEYRRNLVTSTEQERSELLSALDKQERDALALASLYPSPAAFLGRIGLGSTQHASLITSLTGAGPVELEQRAREALMTNNRVLASAVLTVVDRLPRKDRPFSGADFAQAAVGEEHKALVAKFDEMKRQLTAARDLDREFVSGKSDPLSKIARGVASRKAKGV